MNRWHAFGQLILARVREFYREPEAIFWVYGFPLLLAAGLGIAFSSSAIEPPAVDILNTGETARVEKLANFLRDKKLPVEVHDKSAADERLFKDKTTLYLKVDDDKITFIYDPSRSESMLARKWVENLIMAERLGTSGPRFGEDPLKERGRRYIDFLLPGLIGMNIMGGGLFGLGFVLVDMRVRKLFKRLLATPMRRGDFLLSLLTARLFFLFPEMLALILLGRLIFGVPMLGSPLTLLLVIVCGALAFAGIGLLAGCRTDKTETISGIINLVMLPMYLLSGIFFSADRFPEVAQPFIQALPLTQLNNALREVMLQGAGLNVVGWRLLALAAWAIVTFTLALRWFRWN